VISGVPSPFFLEDVTPRSARVPPEYASHANGATGVSRLVVAVADLASAVDRYERIFGEKANPTDDIAGARAVNFARGTTTLTLAEPEAADSALHDQLKARGESPFQVQLSGLKSGFIDPDRLHGARIATDN